LKVVHRQPGPDIQLKEVVERMRVEDLKDRQRQWRRRDARGQGGKEMTRITLV
jgi:hypothetical protein